MCNSTSTITRVEDHAATRITKDESHITSIRCQMRRVKIVFKFSPKNVLYLCRGFSLRLSLTHSLEDGGRGDAGAQEEAKVAEVVPYHEVVPFFVVLEGARNVS